MGHISGTTDYTITQHTESIIAGSSPNSYIVYLQIDPRNGAKLSAEKFYVQGAIETPIASGIWDCTSNPANTDVLVNKVTFEDNGTPATTTNTVKVTVELDSFTMPVANKTIDIDIDVEEDPPTRTDRYLCLREQNIHETGHTITETCTSACSPNPSSSSATNVYTNPYTGVTGNFYQHEHKVTMQQPAGVITTHLLFKRVYTCDSGMYYITPPYLETNPVSSPWFQTVLNSGGLDWTPYFDVQISNDVYNSYNQLTSRTIEVYYTPPVNVTGMDPDPTASGAVATHPNEMCELGLKMGFNHEIAKTAEPPGVTKTITGLNMDYLTLLGLPSEKRMLQLTGTDQAQCSIHAKRMSDNYTYDFTLNTWTSAATDSGTQTIPNYGSYNISSDDIQFPAHTGSVSIFYHVWLVPEPGTTIASTAPDVNNPYILEQPIVELKIIPESTNSTANFDDFTDVVGYSFSIKPTIFGYNRESSSTRGFGSGYTNPYSKYCSWVIKPSHIAEGRGEALNIKDDPVFKVSGNPSSANVDGAVNNSTTVNFDADLRGVTVGMGVYWEVFKEVDRDIEDSKVIVLNNVTDLEVGMKLKGINGSVIKRKTTITSINAGNNSITVSHPVTLDKTVKLTDHDENTIYDPDRGTNPTTSPHDPLRDSDLITPEYSLFGGLWFTRGDNIKTVAAIDSGKQRITTSAAITVSDETVMRFTNSNISGEMHDTDGIIFEDGKIVKSGTDIIITGNLVASEIGNKSLVVGLDLDSLITLT